VRTACVASTPSWLHLAGLRKRGQRPTAGVFVTDNPTQQRLLVASGCYAVGFPHGDEVTYAAGLEVVVIAARNPSSIEHAQRIATVNPRYLATYWRGSGLEVVIS
jgi:hypothetical protein